MELSIEKFDPTVEELNKMVVASKKVTVTDIDDKAQIQVVRENRIALKSARVAITKRGKEMREEANAFQKAVIAKEKELVAIIEPEELRLEAIEDEVKEKQLRAERELLLPSRKEELAKIGDSVEVTDAELLSMDVAQFSAYKNDRVAQKNEVDRRVIEEARAQVHAEEERQQREKETRAREEIARKEEQELAERRLKEEKERAELRIQQEKEGAERRVIAERERVEREQKEKEEREAQAKAETARLEKEEREKLEGKKKYQVWLSKNLYDENTHYLRNEGGTIKLYKLVGTFKI